MSQPLVEVTKEMINGDLVGGPSPGSSPSKRLPATNPLYTASLTPGQTELAGLASISPAPAPATGCLVAPAAATIEDDPLELTEGDIETDNEARNEVDVEYELIFDQDLDDKLLNEEEDEGFEDVDMEEAAEEEATADWRGPCRQLVDRMVTILGSEAHIFYNPVDIAHHSDYLTVVQTPVCLKNMEDRLKEDQYDSPEDFREDFDLMIENCRKYNRTRFKFLLPLANKMEKEFYNKWRLLPWARGDEEVVWTQDDSSAEPDGFVDSDGVFLCTKPPKSGQYKHNWHLLREFSERDVAELYTKLPEEKDSDVLDKVVPLLTKKLRIVNGEFEWTLDGIRGLGRVIFWQVFPLVCRKQAPRPPEDPRLHVEGDSD